jgi:hypothetical protein
MAPAKARDWLVYAVVFYSLQTLYKNPDNTSNVIKQL